MLDEAHEEATDTDLREEEPAELRCSACGHPVTTSAERISVNGDHRHVCVNPRGVTYDIGCFRQAPGLRLEDQRMTVFTWFEGFAWQAAYCAGCGAHLGWWFSREGEAFAGLVVRRLAEG